MNLVEVELELELEELELDELELELELEQLVFGEVDKMSFYQDELSAEGKQYLKTYGVFFSNMRCRYKSRGFLFQYKVYTREQLVQR